MEGSYYIISAANIQMDTIMKAVAGLYSSDGGVFSPIFNTDGTKVLIQIKGNVTTPANVKPAALVTSGQLGLAVNLAVAEWQLRIYPPATLTASYIGGSITLGQYLTQVRLITPQQATIKA